MDRVPLGYHDAMPERRRRSGFEKLGSVHPETAGLARPQARRLLLAHAWSVVAGPALSKRIVAKRVVRGVLELEVSDPAWGRELKALIPSLAGRLAGRFPGLGVKKLRLLVGGSAVSGEAIEVKPDT